MMKWLCIDCRVALCSGSCRVTLLNGTLPMAASKCPSGSRVSAKDSARTVACGYSSAQIAALGDRYNPATNATVTGTLTNVQNAVATLDKAFGALGNPDDLAANLRRLQDGIGQLASGAQALATGVRTLADSNIEMLSGMSQIATQLQNSARAAQDSDSASGFYLPANAFENRQFTDVAKQFLSPDGKTARFMIETSYDPYSVEAMDLANQITHTASTARPNWRALCSPDCGPNRVPIGKDELG